MSAAINLAAMLQLCQEDGLLFDRVFGVRFDGHSWAIATNGAACLCVRVDDISQLAEFPRPIAKMLDAAPPISWRLSWHDLNGWLRERTNTPIDVSAIVHTPIDRNLLARFLAPVYSPTVLIGVEEPILGHWPPVLLQAEDDSWRRASWLPRGVLEAA